MTENNKVIKVDFVNKKVISKIEDTSKTITEEKVDLFKKLLGTSGPTQTVIDATHDKVIVPNYLKQEPRLPINWSYSFKVNDFNFDMNGIQGTLSFNGNTFRTYVPWDAVWAMFKPTDMSITPKIWNENVPIVKAQVNDKPKTPNKRKVVKSNKKGIREGILSFLKEVLKD